MTRAIEVLNLFTYRFHARFWKGYAPTGDPIDLGGRGFASLEVGAERCGMRMTPGGLEVWRGHVVEEPILYDLIHMAKTVEVVLFSRDPEKKSRVITMNIDKPRCLPFRLDAMDSSVAMDGVLFQETEVLHVADEIRQYPEGGQP
jgi:hypothetical protein